MAALNRFSVVELLVLRSSSQIVARGHRETVRNQIGAAEDQDDARQQVSPNDSRDDRECGHGAVDAAIDPIPEIAVGRSGRKSSADGLVGVLVFHDLASHYGPDFRCLAKQLSRKHHTIAAPTFL